MIKFISALLGFGFFGIFGAILGWFAGSVMQRFFNYGSGGVNPFTTQQRQQVFLKSLFQLAGVLAKADGKVSRIEIDHVEQLITQMGMNAATRTQSINFFREGTQDNFDVDSCLREFIEVCGRTRNLRQTLLTYLVSLAYADSKLDRKERDVLGKVASALGISTLQLNAFISMFEHQQRFSQSGYSQSGYTNASSRKSLLLEAYAALGIQASASDQEVKKAYRKLMSQNHPDKLMGQGVPEDMLKVATEKSKAIQRAYDLIKKSRAEGK